MSWWISITNPDTEEYIQVERFEEGGTYTLGGSTDADLNVTYNYSKHFHRVLNIEGGFRGLDGMTIKDALPIIQKGIELLIEDYSDDYWEATEGNTRKALIIVEKWCNQAIEQGIPHAKIRVN